ncbi:hypothetical protein BGZ83_003687 [Gryganskiella cystojenkinii]|nr:hypothetical protein BGZ83_003687 [Gryganskiella cystojenkinii]
MEEAEPVMLSDQLQVPVIAPDLEAIEVSLGCQLRQVELFLNNHLELAFKHPDILQSKCLSGLFEALAHYFEIVLPAIKDMSDDLLTLMTHVQAHKFAEFVRFWRKESTQAQVKACAERVTSLAETNADSLKTLRELSADMDFLRRRYNELSNDHDTRTAVAAIEGAVSLVGGLGFVKGSALVLATTATPAGWVVAVGTLISSSFLYFMTLARRNSDLASENKKIARDFEMLDQFNKKMDGPIDEIGKKLWSSVAALEDLEREGKLVVNDSLDWDSRKKCHQESLERVQAICKACRVIFQHRADIAVLKRRIRSAFDRVQKLERMAEQSREQDHQTSSSSSSISTSITRTTEMVPLQLYHRRSSSPTRTIVVGGKPRTVHVKSD